MRLSHLLKKGALYLSTAFALAVGGDIALRQMTQEKQPLSSSQIDAAVPIFGDMIDYAKVKHVDGCFSFLQPKHRVVTLGNTIYIPKGMSIPKHDYIHELGHVCQNQNDMPGTGIGGALHLWLHTFNYNDSYMYTLDSTKALSDYNMEQQASMIAYCYQVRENLKDDPTRIDASAHTYEKELPMLERTISKTLPLKPDTAVKYLFTKTP